MSSSYELYERVLFLGFLNEVCHTSEFRPRATTNSKPLLYQKSKKYSKTKSKHLLDTSLEMAPKHGEPCYCTKNVATPRGFPTLIYQPEVHTNLEVTVIYTQ